MFCPHIVNVIGMFHPGLSEMMIILFIAFLIFGAKRVPEIAHSLGKGIKDFQVGLKEPSLKNEESQKLMPQNAPQDKVEQVQDQFDPKEAKVIQ